MLHAAIFFPPWVKWRVGNPNSFCDYDNTFCVYPLHFTIFLPRRSFWSQKAAEICLGRLGYKMLVKTGEGRKLAEELSATNWPSPCSSTRIRSHAAAADLDMSWRSSGWRPGMRHSVLWENWQNRSSARYSQELIYEPDSCISSYLEKHWNTSGDDCFSWLAEICKKYVLDCVYSLFTKTTYILIPPLPLWSSFSELSEELSPRL